MARCAKGARIVNDGDSNVLVHPNCVACETCSQGVACMVVDYVLLCEECCEVLGVSPAAMRTSEPVCVPEPQKSSAKPSLLDRIAPLLRDTK
jgi:hypothetical protein